MSDLLESLQQESNVSKPKHVAIIMDGNGRWGLRQKRSRVFGLQAGFETVRKIITASRKLDLGSLTLFAFSTENWSRPQKEVDFIMTLLMRALKKEAKMIGQFNIVMLDLSTHDQNHRCCCYLINFI